MVSSGALAGKGQHIEDARLCFRKIHLTEQLRLYWVTSVMTDVTVTHVHGLKVMSDELRDVYGVLKAGTSSASVLSSASVSLSPSEPPGNEESRCNLRSQPENVCKCSFT